MYSDRLHAGHVLADMLKREKTDYDIVVSLVRGAVPISVIIAEKLNAELVLMPIRKIGPLENEEFAVACVTENTIVHNPTIIIPSKDKVIIQALGDHVSIERDKINNMKSYITSHLSSEGVKLFDYSRINGKNVLIVDDGIATGTTVLCAISECRKNGPLKVSVAAPVSSKEALEMISDSDITVHCPFVPEEFLAVGQFYERFSQVSEEQIVSIIRGFIERRRGNTTKV